MKIVIAGGTGFLGGTLLPYFKNDEVVILTRNHRSSHENVRYATWNAHDLDQWYHELDGADVLINLNGKSVDCRYTEKNKRLIYETRLKSTAVLGEAILNCEHPPAVWINASSATIYQHSEDKMMDEYNGDIGDDFSMDVCKSWDKYFTLSSYHPHGK
ncbi:NAD-dependent epimerase/dehydratase family protein [Fulvivirga ligni]|uniref:NAD-dependent epimerase/dehydratase family protein n=1 Tax=Fulvivirga ligni TaxID=2904246 RepID=UPI001F331F2D|nr:NAD-dependent epimerase/dehydratase family protein [Fulvivirga ligni]UII20461.1 NAD-dependent epimerase/dehydratase family protein [Fulvivirga ligni]